MRRLSDERGNVAIIVALLMTTLMGIGALVVDYGILVTQDTSLQTGADSAALAIAKNCAEHTVSPTAIGCSDAMASSVAASYFNANAGSGITIDRDLDVSYNGRAGRVTVTGHSSEEPVFATLLGISDPQPISATATARWGPLTAEDAAFPMVVCKGALPPPGGGQVTLAVDAGVNVSSAQCDDNADELPFGWIPPDDTSDCTANVILLPSSYHDVGPPDEPPTGSNCDDRVAELFNDIGGGAFCHDWPWWRGYHCHGLSAPASQRTRVLAVYNAGVGTAEARPAYSLVAFEFTGARIADQEAHRGTSEACPQGQHCIRGYVREYLPPEDGPIVDPMLAALPGIEDTTVLDVRLVE